MNGRWFGCGGSEPLHRMQNVPDGLSVWDSPIWEGWKDAEMRFLLGPIKEGVYSSLYECLAYSGTPCRITE